MAKNRKLIVNLTRGTPLCEGVLADRMLSRMRGLLGRDSLPAGEGMLLRPAPSIHTAFMRFPIDALFLDRDLTVLGIEPELPPWRIASRRRARAVLELAAGESGRLGVRVGDRLSLRDRDNDCGGDEAGERDSGLESASIGSTGSATALLEREPALGVDPAPEGSVDDLEEVVLDPAADFTEAEQPDAAGSELDMPSLANVRRMRPMSVLVLSSDRRFRSVASVLIARRGCAIATTENADRLEELVRRVRADVVVIDLDGSRASVAARRQAEGLAGVGIVAVEEEPVRSRDPEGLQALAKWGPFERLYAAIEAADEGRSSIGGIDGRA